MSVTFSQSTTLLQVGIKNTKKCVSKNRDFRKSREFTAMIGINNLVNIIDSLGTHIVVCKSLNSSSTHTNIKSIVSEVPQLTNPSNIFTLAKIINFILEGAAYKFIDDPMSYKIYYKDRIEKEGASFDLPPGALINYGIFNVDEIAPPNMKGNLITFYVEREIPYRVTCYNIQSSPPKFHYSLLPYREK